MLIPRIFKRLLHLSRWEPPPGIFRVHAVSDDGTIKVTLSCGLLHESVLVCPGCEPSGVYAELDALAAALLAADANLTGPAGLIVTVLGGAEGGDPDSEPERRLATRLELGMDAFEEGIRRATKGSRH